MTRGTRWSDGGIYLALDTSGPVGSVAAARGRQVTARAFLLRSQEQAQRILPAIEAVLGESGLTRGALAGVVVGAGPGSFTGLRIAAATAKGLTHALGVPLWGFSSLAAGAFSDRVLSRAAGMEGWWEHPSDENDDSGRYVLFDARGDRLYAACHGIRRDGSLTTLVPPHATSVATLLEGPVPENVAFCGDGALRHADRLRAAGHRVLGPPAGVPTADALLHMLGQGEDVAPVDASSWEPQYLKASNAEREAPLFDARRPHA